jgi:hypothetical protein
MNRWISWIVTLACGAMASYASAQSPVLSTLETPHPALQAQVTMAGSTYGPGTVAYGPPNTPLVLSGYNFGDNGVIWFIPYKNGVIDTNTAPTPGIVTLWAATQIVLKVPGAAVSGLVKVVTNDKASNGLPFIVTTGTYTTSCSQGPASTQLQITSDSLQDGTANHAYSAQLKAVPSTDSLSWSLVSGSLPSGLSLSNGGLISGTPTAASSAANFTVQVVDNNTQQRDEAILSLQVAANPEAGSSSALYSFSIQTTGGGCRGL